MVREFEHIITEITDKQKRKPKETVLNEINTLSEAFTTVEYYPISRLIVLLNYLSDLAIDFPLSKGEALFESREKSSKSSRIHTQLRVIERILNLPDDVPAVIDRDDLIVLNAYGYKSHHCKGRMYGKRNSMTLISRQCRYYLFKDRYYDIDLKNAHPSMLLFYAKSNDIEVPNLEKYVYNREEFLAEITETSGISRSEAKMHVLRAINLITDKHLPDSLKPLFHDILPIRNHLFDANLGKTVTELGEYCLTRESFTKRNLEQQKISLQSHYCTTEESKCLEVLREVCLHKGQLDREAKLSKEARNLSFVPFFDGAYVYFDSLSDKKQVESILDDTNSLITPYIFELKEIQPEWDYIDEKDLLLYEKMLDFMGKLSSQGIENLLEYLGIPAFSLNESKLKGILSGVSSKEELENLKQGRNNEFNEFVAESAKKYHYDVRRGLLACMKRGELTKLEGIVKVKKRHPDDDETHST